MIGRPEGQIGSALARQFLSEQEEWESLVRAKVGPSASLMHISVLDTDRRIYRYGNRVAKIVRIRGDQSRRWYSQSLEQELLAMNRIDALNVVYEPVYEATGEWQILTSNYISGNKFGNEWRNLGVAGKLSLLLRTAQAIDRVNHTGVCHDDITAQNVLVSRDGRVKLVDFGDASFASPMAARAKEWRNLLFGRYGLAQRWSKRTALALVPPLQRVYRRMKMRHVAAFSMDIADATSVEPVQSELQCLERAWREAARWNSGEGQWLAYPALTVAGVHFAGHRPWVVRWLAIRDAVDFRNKCVVDLGCNLGLLTSFAILAGASAATGIEADRSLVSAAREVAAAFGVPATFLHRDLGGPGLWEDEVAGADIVVAMSIMEWVPDRDRLLRYIGQYAEVIYEGHEPLASEVERLRSVGFRHVEVVMVSDAGRAVLHGWKGSGTSLADSRSW